MIIGLAGKKQSGKTSLAHHLIEEYGFVEYSWALPLKETCKNLFGLTEEQVYGTEEDKEAIIPEWNMSARDILQKVGTEMFRGMICRDFWVKVGMKNLVKLKDAGYDIVISDCRFPNELEAVQKLGGYTGHVVRIGQVSTDSHTSETALDNWTDYSFIFEAVSGDLGALYAQAAVYITPLLERDN